MKYPYIVSIKNPLLIDEAKVVATELMELDREIHNKIEKHEQLRTKLWDVLGQDDNIDNDKYEYTYDAEHHTISCTGKQEEPTIKFMM